MSTNKTLVVQITLESLSCTSSRRVDPEKIDVLLFYIAHCAKYGTPATTFLPLEVEIEDD